MINITPKNTGLGAIQTEYRKQKNTNVKSTEIKKESFDQILINKVNQTNTKPALNESQFISGLKSQISAEVQKGASEYKLADLSKQIALDEYDINPADIARKMMMNDGDK